MVDALAWPALLILALRTAPFSTGIFGLTALALTVLIAARRLERAVARNHRYRFTTLRWGTYFLLLVSIGIGSRLMS